MHLLMDTWRPLYGVQIMDAWRPLYGVQIHLLMDAWTHGDPYMGCRCTCSWMHGDNNGDPSIWGAAELVRGCMENPWVQQWNCIRTHPHPIPRGLHASVGHGDPALGTGMGCGCMETPGYGVWMHGDPCIWPGADVVGAWRLAFSLHHNIARQPHDNA